MLINHVSWDDPPSTFCRVSLHILPILKRNSSSQQPRRMGFQGIRKPTFFFPSEGGCEKTYLCNEGNQKPQKVNSEKKDVLVLSQSFWDEQFCPPFLRGKHLLAVGSFGRGRRFILGIFRSFFFS